MQNAGYKWSYSANCYYTGGSGTTYRSSVTATATAPTKITTPNTPSSITGSINEDNDFKINWSVSTSSTKPVTKQQVVRSVNGVNRNTVSISNGTTRTYTWSSVADNSRYLASVRVGNSAGWSAWKTLATPLYTKPAAPTNLVAIKNGNQVTASVVTSNVRYLQECAWQYRDNTVEPAAWIDISGTSNRITATVEAEDITVRVQAINQGNKASDWVEGIPGVVGNERVYVRMPDEAFVDGKLKDGTQVNLRIDDGAVSKILDRAFDSRMTVESGVLSANGDKWSVLNGILTIEK